MRAPWFSSIAQGTALTLFVRLYTVTGEQRWRKAADSTFATFPQRRMSSRPWISFILRRPGQRYLWFEDYPKNPPTRVLSGHMSAIFGVYEYALATKKAQAVAVFDGGVTTVRHLAEQFRVRHGISYYSLRVRAQYRFYHCLHVQELKLLGHMTRNPWFGREAGRFSADAPSASTVCLRRSALPLRRAFPRPGHRRPIRP
jgi:hypothetical protein